jgi:putative SOS response-associated peptidase YedK
MPVVLKPEAWPAWLGEESADPTQLKALLAPYPSDDMICCPVSPGRIVHLNVTARAAPRAVSS